jgi:hypothetical protein
MVGRYPEKYAMKRAIAVKASAAGCWKARAMAEGLRGPGHRTG